MLGRDGGQTMMNPSTFYSPLHSMWAAGAGTFAAAAPAITPTSSTSAPSPPTSRDYEVAGNASPDNYGYPPTPPKEVKVEESSYPNSSSAISVGEMYKSRPEGSQSYTSSTSPSTFQSSSDLSSPFYGSYSTTGIVSSFEKSSLKSSSSKGKHNHSGKISYRLFI